MIESLPEAVGQVVEKSGVTLDRLITDAPWSSVWHGARSTGEEVVVKYRKRNVTSAPEVFCHISDILGKSVPKLVMHDRAANTSIMSYVSNANSKKRVSRDEILATYGQAQVLATQDLRALSGLPTFQPLACLDFVRHLTNGQTIASDGLCDPNGNLFTFMDPTARDTAKRVLDAYAEKIVGKVGALDHGPRTLEHTDLTPRNVVRDANGQLVIIDWDDAVIAHPGLSLHMIFGGSARVAASLLRPDAYRENALAQSDIRDLRRYIKVLEGNSGFTRDFLIESLPIMAVFGTLKYISDMSFFDLTQDGLGEIVAQEAVQKLKSVAQAMIVLFPQPRMARAQKDPPLRNVECPFVNIRKNPSAAAEAFRKNGALRVRGAFSRNHVISAYKEVAGNAGKFYSDIKSGRALRVGERRYMVSMDTSGVIGQPQTLASPRILTLMHEILGSDCILGSATSVIALDGSDAQQWHRDNDVLFPAQPDLEVPPYCITVMLPLLPLNAQNGSTEMVLGSHKSNAQHADPDMRTFPETRVGDCYLMDCRLLHRGMPNKSPSVRPVISLVYQKPWYRDYQNFNNQAALEVTKDVVASFPKEHRNLVNWAVRGNT